MESKVSINLPLDVYCKVKNELITELRIPLTRRWINTLFKTDLNRAEFARRYLNLKLNASFTEIKSTLSLTYREIDNLEFYYITPDTNRVMFEYLGVSKVLKTKDFHIKCTEDETIGGNMCFCVKCGVLKCINQNSLEDFKYVNFNKSSFGFMVY